MACTISRLGLDGFFHECEEVTPAFIPRTKESILARVEQLPDSPGCWLWTGRSVTRGYGMLGHDIRAHRLAYELWQGAIPEGMEIDHLCRVSACVRPDHLEAVTHKENVRRGIGPTSVNDQKKICPEGHPYNRLAWEHGRRRCLSCNRDYQRGWMKKYRAMKVKVRNAME